MFLLFIGQLPCDKLSIEEEVKTRDFIAIGRIDEDYDAGGTDPNYAFYILDFFKGKGNQRKVIYAPDFEFENNTYYLIFADGKDGNSHYVDQCSNTDKLNSVDPSTLNYLYEYLGISPCFDPVLKQEMEDGACQKNLYPVCGCNGITYGNACSAFKNGITKYLNGKCK